MWETPIGCLDPSAVHEVVRLGLPGPGVRLRAHRGALPEGRVGRLLGGRGGPLRKLGVDQVAGLHGPGHVGSDHPGPGDLERGQPLAGGGGLLPAQLRQPPLLVGGPREVVVAVSDQEDVAGGAGVRGQQAVLAGKKTPFLWTISTGNQDEQHLDPTEDPPLLSQLSSQVDLGIFAKP